MDRDREDRDREDREDRDDHEDRRDGDDRDRGQRGRDGTDGDRGDREAAPGPGPSWSTRVILTAAALVATAALLSIAAGSLPLWWARRIAAVADGSRPAGAATGLACGLAFTLVPLLMLRRALRRRRAWQSRVWLMAVAVVVAVPNLLTLGMRLGSYGDAERARQVADLGAPGFRGASLDGAVAGAALAVGFWWLLGSRARRGHRIAELEEELSRGKAPDGSDHRGGAAPR